MTDEEGTGRYAAELGGWVGFKRARQVREFLGENEELVVELESQLPGVTARVEALLDLVDGLRSVPPHALPVGALTGAENPIDQLFQQLQNAPQLPSALAPQLETSASQAIVALAPWMSLLGEDSASRVSQDLRAETYSILHGIRTAAGQTRSVLEQTTNELKEQGSAAEADLRKTWDSTREGLVNEAAQMRERIETSLSESRTNAEAHLIAMRGEVSQVRQRADNAYQEALAQFEQERASLAETAGQAKNSVEGIVADLAQGAEHTREKITEDVEGLRARLQDTVAWAEGIKGDIQMAALAAGFQRAQATYRRRSLWALSVAASLGVAAVLLTLAFFSRLWDVPNSATNAEIARHVGFRLGAISLPLVAAIFAARVYRTNSHLEAVNGERAQASTAFEGFAERASGDASRDAMLVVLAQLVFAGRDTGHHADEKIGLPLDVSSVLKQFR